MTRPFDFKPIDPETRLTTIHALKAWMIANRCNGWSYDIGGSTIFEGYRLIQNAASFDWVYTERGVESVVKRFAQESDAVAYAFAQIRRDGFAWAYHVCSVRELAQRDAIKHELESRNIGYYDDAIPYGGMKDMRYRIYVHVSDADAVTDLVSKYHDVT
ncbi:hypothetical protein QTO30_11160 [Yoonia sp. GPGPB17]|uniref:hypothetical protein n=1 Tax=Yoonia sp. GPGPB17 TaxID=3026147 RepID=UPI0030C2792E